MVCLGNICRSPLAEGIFRELTNHSEYHVDSAGTANYHSEAAPDPRSIAVAAKNGIDISSQRARQLTSSDMDAFDHILVMDDQNYIDALSLCTSENQREKIALLTKASGVDATHVPDPYYGDNNGFDTVFELVHKCCVAWLEKH